MNNCDPTQQQAAQDRLEQLYEADGRHDPAHPMHGLYTALHKLVGEQAIALINHDPMDQPFLSEEGIATIRTALERLQQLEQENHG